MKDYNKDFSDATIAKAWNMFVETPYMKAVIHDDEFAKWLVIHENTVDEIGKTCGNDFRNFVDECLKINRGDSISYYDFKDLYFIKRYGDVYVSEETVRELLEYIFDAVFGEDFNIDAIQNQFNMYLTENAEELDNAKEATP